MQCRSSSRGSTTSRIDPVTGERMRLSSAILPAWSRKSPQVSEALPPLYLHGLSTSDFAPALEQLGVRCSGCP